MNQRSPLFPQLLLLVFLFLQETKAEQVLQEICSVSPETVDQLNLDSEDRVCDQLSGINHKGFFGALR